MRLKKYSNKGLPSPWREYTLFQGEEFYALYVGGTLLSAGPLLPAEDGVSLEYVTEGVYRRKPNANLTTHVANICEDSSIKTNVFPECTCCKPCPVSKGGFETWTEEERYGVKKPKAVVKPLFDLDNYLDA